MACDGEPAQNQAGLAHIDYHGPVAHPLGEVPERVEGVAGNGELDLAHPRPADGGHAQVAVAGSDAREFVESLRWMRDGLVDGAGVVRRNWDQHPLTAIGPVPDPVAHADDVLLQPLSEEGRDLGQLAAVRELGGAGAGQRGGYLLPAQRKADGTAEAEEGGLLGSG